MIHMCHRGAELCTGAREGRKTSISFSIPVVERGNRVDAATAVETGFVPPTLPLLWWLQEKGGNGGGGGSSSF